MTDRPTAFEPFQWWPITDFGKTVTVRAHDLAQFMGIVRDISGGLATIAELLESHEIDGVCSDGNGKDLPGLKPLHHGRLLRLAVHSANELEALAQIRGDRWLNREPKA